MPDISLKQSLAEHWEHLLLSWLKLAFLRKLVWSKMYEYAFISVVDAYDAMTTDRGYQRVLSKQEALEEITRCAGSQFDPRIAFTFVEKFI